MYVVFYRWNTLTLLIISKSFERRISTKLDTLNGPENEATRVNFIGHKRSVDETFNRLSVLKTRSDLPKYSRIYFNSSIFIINLCTWFYQLYQKNIIVWVCSISKLCVKICGVEDRLMASGKWMLSMHCPH